MDEDRIAARGSGSTGITKALFFLSWTNWARFSFVLGSVFVVAVSAGIIARVLNRRRNKRLESTAAVEELAERGELVLTIYVEDEAAFGLSGFEEEQTIAGLWNSRTATPLQTPSTSSRGSSPIFPPMKKLQKSRNSSSLSSVPNMDIPEPMFPRRGTHSDTAMLDRGNEDNDVGDGPHRTVPGRKKGRSIVINYSGPSSGPDIQTPGSTVDAQGPPTIGGRVGTWDVPQKLRLQPSFTRTSSDRKFVIGGRRPQATSPPRQPHSATSGVFAWMEAHRNLHAAECGQLIPKGSRHTSMDSKAEQVDNASDSDRDEHLTGRAVSWPARDGEMYLSRNLSRKPRRMVSPQAVPFSAFVEMHPPPASSRTCPSAWTEKTQVLVEDKLSVGSKPEDIDSNYAGRTSLPSLSSTVTLSTSNSSEDTVSIANTKARKINKGFEVLPAGTFERSPVIKEFGLWPEPVKENLNENRKPRKLQKRRSSGSSGRRSSAAAQGFYNSELMQPMI